MTDECRNPAKPSICVPCGGRCVHTIPNCEHPHECGECATCVLELCP